VGRAREETVTRRLEKPRNGWRSTSTFPRSYWRRSGSERQRIAPTPTGRRICKPLAFPHIHQTMSAAEPGLMASIGSWSKPEIGAATCSEAQERKEKTDAQRLDLQRDVPRKREEKAAQRSGNSWRRGTRRAVADPCLKVDSAAAHAVVAFEKWRRAVGRRAHFARQRSDVSWRT
jgi:hypothetical protein